MDSDTLGGLKREVLNLTEIKGLNNVTGLTLTC